MSENNFGCCIDFESGEGTSSIYSLEELQKRGIGSIATLPFSIRILLEQALRNVEESKANPEDVNLLANWNASQNSSLSNSRISVVLKNEPGSLGKVTTVIAKNNGNISNINFSTRKKDFFEIIIDIEVRDINHLNNIIAALRLLNEVSSLNRIKG